MSQSTLESSCSQYARQSQIQWSACPNVGSMPGNDIDDKRSQRHFFQPLSRKTNNPGTRTFSPRQYRRHRPRQPAQMRSAKATPPLPLVPHGMPAPFGTGNYCLVKPRRGKNDIAIDTAGNATDGRTAVATPRYPMS